MPEIREYFTAEYGDKKYETKGQLPIGSGLTPLIAAGTQRNGVFGLVEIPATKRHVLSVSRTGTYVGMAFYHGSRARSVATLLS